MNCNTNISKCHIPFQEKSAKWKDFYFYMDYTDITTVYPVKVLLRVDIFQ